MNWCNKCGPVLEGHAHFPVEDKMKIHTDDCLGGETCDCPFSLDLDKCEREVRETGRVVDTDGTVQLALIALARKGQFYDEHVLTETANHLAETAKEWKQRAEAYERALREIIEMPSPDSLGHKCVRIAREALEAAKKE